MSCGHTEGELLATIKCDLNGGAISNLYSTSGQTITLNTPTKENSEFWGWKKSGETAYSDTISMAAPVDATYTAEWKRTVMDYAIIYDGNNETDGAMANGMATQGVPYIIGGNGFTKTGYSFTG